MFDTAQPAEFCLTDAQIVTPDSVVHGSVTVQGGLITGIGAPDAPGIGMNGDYLIPGLVDVHTDHVEKHVFPRKNVRWSPDVALAAHDGVVTAAGVTTVFDSICVGSASLPSPRAEILMPLVRAITSAQAQGRFRADHLLHLRCEICDPATPDLFDQVLTETPVQLVSVMDHAPGDRQCPDVEDWILTEMTDFGIDRAAAEKRTYDLMDRSRNHGPTVRAHVVGKALAAGVTIMSHDDRTIAHIDDAWAEGTTVSEFPTTVAAAQRAREVGQAIVAGAPNYVRGGSQSGNIAVKDLLAAGLVDVLSSDYVPASMLMAAFLIAEDNDLPFTLPQALAMVTARPAEIAGLTDRGRIQPGLRADLVQVQRANGHGHVSAIWRGGRRVF